MNVMSPERKSNFELMRIVAILPIVAWHFLGQGGVMGAARPDTIFLGMGGRMAVNIFLILGCWFMTDAGSNPKRALKLYLQVAFYSIPITLLMMVLGESGGFRNIFQGLVPFFGRSVWFASAYISLILVSPFLQRAFDLPRRELTRLAGLLFVLFCIVSTIPNFSPIDYVADFCWFCAVYVMTGWAKRENFFARLPGKWTCLVLAVGLYAVLCAAICWTPAAPLASYWLQNIKSLPSLAIAVFVFAFFLKLDIGAVRWINLAARSVFATYIIHQIPAFIHFEWFRIFRAGEIARFTMPERIGATVGVVLVVFAGAWIIDGFWLFVMCKLENRNAKLHG